ncbi:MAG: thiamine pyrophosphate-binding protein [Candidatus Methanoperedens sp.]|nr:thiamine pyrophosphate-binding protein [Candidatus Methanoperedens sp.]
MSRFRCTVCNYIYDEEKEKVKFSDLPPGWICPVCSAPRSAFERMGTGNGGENEAKGEVITTTVGEKILEQLTAAGVRYIFGIPGDSNLPLVDAISKQDRIKFILTRHEETAALMASAHGKLTGDIAACLSIAGPGATNLITGLVDATTDGAPVLALVGQVAQAYLGSEHLQEIDEIEIFAPFTVYHETIAKPAQALRATTMALKNAYSRRGAAMLSLPTDVLSEKLDDSIWDVSEHIFKPNSVPDDEDIDYAAALINESKRPLLFIGWGIKGGGEEVIQLAEKISSPVATTSRAKGVIPETHPLAVGVLGSIGTVYAAKAVKNADILIVAGSGFRQRNLVPDIPVIQVDINSVHVGKSFPVKAGMVGDARLALRELIKKVARKIPDKDYFDRINKLKDEHKAEIGKDAGDMSGPISPGYLVQTVKRHASKDALITVDSGDHTYWFYKNYVCDGEETLLSANMGCMAFAFPASLAGQLIYPKRQVICITGDGGFAMLMADFTTAVYNKLPVKVIVFNDGKLKNIKKEQEMYGYREFGVEFVNPDFAEFARSCGGDGFRVEKPEELDSAIEKAFLSKLPVIVDVVVDPDKMAMPTTRVK